MTHFMFYNFYRTLFSSFKNNSNAFKLILTLTFINLTTFAVTCDNSHIKRSEISDSGFWIGDDVEHSFDKNLAEELANFFINEKASSVVDFGCGSGNYVRRLLSAGLICEGYDGNPSLPEMTHGLVKVIDLSVPFFLNKVYDWVLSLEVGEHIPKQYEDIFIENLIRHTGRGIVLSWAIKGQSGVGHVNCQNNDYIKKIFESRGFINDNQAEKFLRDHAKLSWFKNTIMVFRKEKRDSTV